MRALSVPKLPVNVNSRPSHRAIAKAVERIELDASTMAARLHYAVATGG